jgi:phosphoribosylanthranilate isomerase
MLKLKICGLKDPDNIKEIVKLEPDMIGFIFHEGSPRNIGTDQVFETIPETIQKVGVFVDAEPVFVELVSERFQLNAIQLYHHDIKPFQYLRSKLKLIKAVSVRSEKELEKIGTYEDQCDLFLFDAKGDKAGGNGIKFDWNIIQFYKGKAPFILSGGIGPGDTALIRSLDHRNLVGIDINSKFESEPGLKNIKTIQQFKKELYEKLEYNK